jgi:hypothetical protein
MSIILNGIIAPGSGEVVILEANNTLTGGGLLKFKFSAPEAGAYSFNFCVGVPANPCGMSTSYVVTVPGGHEKLALIEASVFRNNVLVVSQGTSTALPFSVTIE